METKKYSLTENEIKSVIDIDGFPIGKKEDIISLSDPPYYTMCPNPFLMQFIKQYGINYDEINDSYQREPYASDIVEGKNDPIYNAHSYHTKVPHKAIMRYILHYTNPNDIIFDGFCGTGMTGIATSFCNSNDFILRNEISEKLPIKPSWGKRYAILNDLCPSATFISYNYNHKFNSELFRKTAYNILKEVDKECSWMYVTRHILNNRNNNTTLLSVEKESFGRINYTVWSNIYLCNNCNKTFSFWDTSMDIESGHKLKEDTFKCPHCGLKDKKNKFPRYFETIYDNNLKKSIKKAKFIPVLINYSILINGKKKSIDKKPDEFDLKLINKINEIEIPYWYPIAELPEGYNTLQPKTSHGFTHVHHFYSKRCLFVSSLLWKKIQESDVQIRKKLIYWFQSVALGQTYLNRYFSSSFSQVNRYLKGTLYVAPIISEVSPAYAFTGKIKKLSEIGNYTNNNIIITTQSSTKLKMPENCVDYIFVDPPFGGNIMYSELNFIWESWLNVYTNNKDEAIKNDYQKKGLQEYQELMEKCFKEFYHILKPNRWITVEFHNSKNSIWIAIQEALNKAGFIIADVRTLDKKQRTMKQMTTINAVEQDLIISAYKPKTSVEKQILNSFTNNENTWIFINNHLKNLPIAVETNNVLESVVERQPYLLYDRMVAFYVQRGIKVPLSAGEFYSGLHRRYPKRDDMYFLPEQVAEYDRKRMTAKNIEQLSLFVHDEKSTVQWLRKELNIRPQTYQEIQPKFLRELHKSGHEQLPELQEVLEENFLQNEHGEWYIPDPLKQTDLEKIREKALLREFHTYGDAKGKLRVFRSEAVRTGFSRCWADADYEGIIKVAEKLPEDVLQEDPTLLMYYDNALTRRSS